MRQVSKELAVALIVNKLNAVFPSINSCKKNQISSLIPYLHKLLVG